MKLKETTKTLRAVFNLTQREPKIHFVQLNYQCVLLE